MGRTGIYACGESVSHHDASVSEVLFSLKQEAPASIGGSTFTPSIGNEIASCCIIKPVQGTRLKWFFRKQEVLYYDKEKTLEEDGSDGRARHSFCLGRSCRGSRGSGPFGAVKEQASGLYAQELAKRGFLTIAFDPSFTGESGGVNGVRNVASPDINTEDFSAAVDFLSTESDVNPDRIGILGICGFGGMALNAAAIDTRIKATVTSTMYDMSRVIANGYFDYEKDAGTLAEERMANRKALNAQRTEDYRTGTYKRAGGVVDPLPADAPQFVKDYYAYYKTKRGYHPRSVNSNEGWNATSALSFMNMPLLSYAGEIESPVLVIHGEKAHSRYFSEGAFKKLKGANKELMIIPGANHTDLYDNMEKIPFDKITAFFQKYLK